MKEMEDNNLFGNDPSDAAPSPQIKEISLRDMTQSVDLTEFRRQNRENMGDLSNLFSSLKETNIDDHNWPPPPPPPLLATGTDLKTPEVEQNDFSLIDVSSGENLISTASTPTLEIPDLQIRNQPSINTAAEFNDVFPYIGNDFDGKTLETAVEPSTELFNDIDSGTKRKKELEFVVNIDSNTPNGDLLSRNFTNTQYHLHPRFNKVLNENGDDSAGSLVRHLSMQNPKNKDSRTYHPRKRQSVYGNNKPSDKRCFNADKFSKEELLLMWKSSEVELNEKLEAAKKDKERLESKLAGLQLHMSTPV